MSKPFGLGAVVLLSGSADPSGGGGVVAPQGSLYLRSGGTPQAWLKTGPGATDWSLLSSGNAQRFTFTAAGGEGSSFNVALPATRANANYQVFSSMGDVTAALAITTPETGRTTTEFPVLTSSAVTAGDKIEFLVVDPT